VEDGNDPEEAPLARELILVRHGQTEWNLEGRLQGTGDSPLTEVGRAQASGHLDWLRIRPPDHLLASPLGRTRATAAILAGGLGLVPEFDPALRERCMGHFEGWTLEEIRRAHPGEHARRQADPWSWRPPGGENYPDLLARTAPLVERLRAHPAQRLLVVSHGTLARPLLGRLLGLEPDTMLVVMVPNDLAYRVDLGAAQGPRASHVRAGVEQPGLLLRAS
jgi:broad specificity phosphatase PhoE